MTRRIVALTATMLMVASGFLVMVLRPAYAAMACRVDYQVTREWSNGFLADLTLTNLGAALPSWLFRFRLLDPRQQIDRDRTLLPPGVRMPGETEGNPVQIGSGETELPAGGTMRIRLAGYYLSNNPAPDEFFLNNLRCNAEDPTASPSRTSPSPSPAPNDPNAPTVALTAPEPNDFFAAPATIPIRADANAMPGRQISRVEFRAAGTLLTTDTTAPYAFTWRGVPPSGGLRVTATAYDNTGARATTEVRGIRIITPGPPGSAPALTVLGNQIVTVEQTPRPYQLRGVVRAGAESRCTQGTGIWDGPVDDASIRAMKTWRINAVRVLLNSDCWFGGPDIPPEYSRDAYRTEITDYVRRLIAHGITPILAPHAGREVLVSDLPRSLAGHFGDDNAVVFDLVGEVYPAVGSTDPATAWACWRDGVDPCLPTGWPGRGTQERIRLTRSGGGFNLLLIGGLDRSNDLSGWLRHRPADPEGRGLAAAWHVDNHAACAAPACWQAQIAPLAAEVPVVATEVSEDAGGHRFTDRVIDWLDARGLGYLASAGTPPATRTFRR